ncbi:MAG TPA: type II secretion system protein GspM [Solirubrobacteraceae bacterium]|nr:type II secretion system protein GspM [Solirubrobacteraceae bacterium]
MTGRDRIVVIGLAVLAVLAGAWLLVVSPKRQQASKLDAQVSEARTQLASAEGQLANARSAQAQYAAAYASIVSLGKAVPPSQEVPSLIYQLSLASNQKSVDFSSIVAGSGSGASSSAAAAPTAAAAGFTQMPFTFVFDGSFFDLEHLFQQLNRFTLRTTSGGVQVSGRLLTIQSLKLSPAVSGSPEPGKGAVEQLSGTITATAYVLPAGQGLTGAATPTSPNGATTPASSTAAGSSSPTAPAIARVTP